MAKANVFTRPNHEATKKVVKHKLAAAVTWKSHSLTHHNEETTKSATVNEEQFFDLDSPQTTTHAFHH